jgi:hypothetical protein
MASSPRFVAQAFQSFLEGVPPRVLPHDEPAFRHADGFGRHDFVILAVLEHAVLVDAAFVGEGVVAHDGLVGLDHEARQAGDQAAGFVDFLGIDACLVGIEVMPGFQDHDDLFQAGVARPLADAVDGAFHLPGPASDGRERVGDGQPQVVMAVDRDDGLADVRHPVLQGRHHMAVLGGDGITHRIGHVDRGGATLDGRLDHAAEVVQVGTGCVLGRKFHVVAEAPGILDRFYRRRQGLFPALTKQVLEMDVGGGNKHVDTTALGGLEGLGAGVDILSHGAAEAGDDGFFQALGNFLHGLKVTRRGRRKTRLDDVHAQLFQLDGDLHFFLGIQAGPGSLFPVPQGGIKDINSVFFVLVRGFHFVLLNFVQGLWMIGFNCLDFFGFQFFDAFFSEILGDTPQEIDGQKGEGRELGGLDEPKDHQADEGQGPGLDGFQFQLFEAGIGNGGNHHQGDDHREDGDAVQFDITEVFLVPPHDFVHENTLAVPAFPAGQENIAGQDARRRRAGQAHEMAFFLDLRLDVETGQADGGANHVKNRDGNTPHVQVTQDGKVNEDGGRHAETYQVGEAVEFHAKLAGRSRGPGDHPIEEISEGRDDDEFRREHEGNGIGFGGQGKGQGVVDAIGDRQDAQDHVSPP